MKKIVTRFILTFMVGLLAACRSLEAGSIENDVTEDQTVTIEDSAGNSVEVPLNPQKVAVYDNGQLDNLKSLGVGDRVILTASPNMPAHLSEFEEVDTAGSFFEIDLEVTNAMEPDLIIVAGRSSSAYEDLAAIAPTIDLSMDSQAYLDSIKGNLETLGTIFQLETKAEEIVEELESDLNHLVTEAQAPEKEALMLMFNEGSLSAYGPGSRFGLIYDAFGFTSVDEDIDVSNHGMEVSYEYVLAQNPDVLFLLDRTAAIGGEVTSKDFEQNAIIQETQSYKDRTIFYLTPSAWYLSEGGAEAFQIMMNEVNEALKN
ncbi:siderophore ABC transporter substrate-binding protein [Alkalibacterium iburiense]|uniref:Siderophore ABC transporter substrate-binding protein n=1 Tax=Alkalibacterium iburiense TaxID=290589 RepID=A0ABP3H323_9LACT